ncbi:MAG: DUF4157 domain-containing protein [Acidimicrobiia bacterium]
MSRRFGSLLVAATLLLTGCALSETLDGSPDISIEIEVPDRIDWRRTIGGVDVFGAGTEPDAAELALLEAALEEVPSALLDLADLRTIYRIPEDADANREEALAFARGPDVYLTDETFDRVAGRFELADVVAHELTHVLQFRSLTEEDLDRITGVIDDEVFSATAFVIDFAAIAGWRDVANGVAPSWVLDDPAGTTAYGRTSPAEDMADTVGHVTAGRAGDVSPRRVAWVEDTLGTSERELAQGKPYLPEGSVEIAPATPLYDEERVAEIAAGPVEPRSFTLPGSSPRASSLARSSQDELARRDIAGSFQRVNDSAVTRFAGEFIRGDGLRFLVELWDFRDAPGFNDPPPQPVLTYVTLG